MKMKNQILFFFLLSLPFSIFNCNEAPIQNHNLLTPNKSSIDTDNPFSTSVYEDMTIIQEATMYTPGHPGSPISWILKESNASFTTQGSVTQGSFTTKPSVWYDAFGNRYEHLSFTVLYSSTWSNSPCAQTNVCRAYYLIGEYYPLYINLCPSSGSQSNSANNVLFLSLNTTYNYGFGYSCPQVQNEE